ncbi:unnamed protein product [Nyctereutes procyonoides]|uniref:(raccoon dog) hypothetical protein n=1 Tax=Nyctereutes procyonoides TaxID=34880 RepID=A0A811ZE25_NYCPR|nr:unnamed protein product [Nyctereutes procyonoides]
MVPGGVGLVGRGAATGAAAPPPARPAAACAHTPSSRRPPARPPARLTRGHHVSPEAPERRRPPRPGPFPDRNVFPASTSPARLKELSPRDRHSKKRLKPGPDAAFRPPQPPALPGSNPESRSSSPRHGNLTSRATGHTPAPLIGSGDYSNSRRPHPVAREASDWSVSHQARPSSPSLAGSVGRPGR